MLYILVFIFGLSVGSFLNVVIYRLETKEPIIKSRSHCPKCGAVLKWFDLIPLISFLIQRGRCRYCGKKISWQYPMVELATGGLFLIIFYQIWNLEFGVQNLFVLCFMLYVICSLLVIFVYDLKHYLIPDKIIYLAIVVALLNLGVNLGVKLPNWEFNSQIYNPLLSAFLASAFFFLLVLISKGKWMGLGDVKLAFLIGLVLGWPNILLALFLSFISGAIIGLTLIVFGKKGLKSEIPFGPFLAGSTILIMLYSNQLMEIEKIFKFF